MFKQHEEHKKAKRKEARHINVSGHFKKKAKKSPSPVKARGINHLKLAESTDSAGHLVDTIQTIRMLHQCVHLGRQRSRTDHYHGVAEARRNRQPGDKHHT